MSGFKPFNPLEDDYDRAADAAVGEDPKPPGVPPGERPEEGDDDPEGLDEEENGDDPEEN